MRNVGVPADEVLRVGCTVVRLPVRMAILVCLIFSGCGANPNSPVGFVNETKHSDAQLWSLWQAAQQSLAQQVDLNPLAQQLDNATPQILPGDARAFTVSPHQLVVSSQPDVSSAALYAATGTMHSDPTGLIACPQPCNVSYAPAYSLYGRPATNYAASWEFEGNNFDQLVQYEFENQILSVLGYDMRWR